MEEKDGEWGKIFEPVRARCDRPGQTEEVPAE